MSADLRTDLFLTWNLGLSQGVNITQSVTFGDTIIGCTS